MYLTRIYIKNYRLLKNVSIDLDPSLTLFVGKNNTGKTSVIDAIDFLCSDKPLSFDDYPIECRKILYDAVKNFWHCNNMNPLDSYKDDVPITEFQLIFNYSDDDETYGELGNFIIGIEEDDANQVIIKITFDISAKTNEILNQCRTQFESLKSKDESEDHDRLVARIVQKAFPKLFEMNIVTVNPSDDTDFMSKSRSDLRNLFCIKSIKAERALDESEASTENPLGQILSKLLRTNLDGVDEKLRSELAKLQSIIDDVNFNVQDRVNAYMSEIVSSMRPFGYPDGEDLDIKASTTLALEKRITDNTELFYVSGGANESLPGTHNGLGYKNLIKISMELHDYAHEVKSDRTKIPILLIEEPEAHMHPQLQTTFVKYLTDFLDDEIGKGIVQVIMTTHSAHVANTVSFSKVRYIRRIRTRVEYRNLDKFPTIGANDNEKHRRLIFLQKYMKISYCDLYFCDKAILVEGASERLLIPDMIKRCKKDGHFDDNSLANQYYTILEVGGAYAHLFYDFVDYLGIPTLVITDIDFINKNKKKCQRDEALHSSNGAIKKWCNDVYGIAETKPIPIECVIKLSEDETKRINGNRRIEFQRKEGNFHPRSLEEAIINVNRQLFNKTEDAIIDFSSNDETKTDFAIKLLYDPKYADYQIPSYIRDGLNWLGQTSRYEEGEEPVIMHRRKYKRHGGGNE